MNWFATVIFAILEVALRSLRNAYKFVGNSRQIGSTLTDLGEMKTSRARPCLAVALSIVLIMCFTSMVTTPFVQAADPGHPASSISAGTFEAGNFTFPDNLTITDYLIVDTDTLYVDALNNRVGIGTSSPTTYLNIKGALDTTLTGTINTSDTTAVANTSDDLTSEISVGDAIKIVNASDFEIFTVNAVTSANLTLDSTPNKNWTEALGYKDSDLFRIDDGDGTGKLIVDKTGNVGIATTSPNYKLEVDGTSDFGNTMTFANGARGMITWGGEGFIVRGESGQNLSLGAGGTSGYMVINTSGQVGIGTTSPLAKLHISGTGVLLNVSNSSDSFLYVDESSGRVGIGTAGPDEKLHVEGDALIDLYGAGNSSGLFFREGFTDSSKYNLGLLVFDDGDASPDALDIAAFDGIYFITGSNDRNPQMVITSAGDVGIGTTGPSYLLEVADGTEDAVNLSGVLYVNDTSNNVGIGLTNPGEKLEVSGNINVTGGNDICIGGGGKCLSTTGTGDGDLTDVLAGYGIAVDNSGGPSPRVNLSNSSAGAGLNYTAGVLAVGDGEGVTVAADSVGFDCSEVTDSASDGMRCSDENLVAGAGDGLSANNTDLEINEGEGVGILADILHFDCSEVTDTANDGVTCSTEDLVIGAGNGLTANATGLEIDLYTGSGLLVDSTGLSMNRSCSNGEILKWVASGSFWNCTEDSGLGSESDTLQSVTDRGNTTTQPMTIDSDSDEQTNIANTLYVNGTVDRVGIGTTSPVNKLDVRPFTSSGSDTIGTGGISLGSDNPYWTFRISATPLADLTFDRLYTGTDYEAMRIQRSTGNVGIGTTSPQQSLHVNGSTVINGTLNMDSNKIISLGNGTAAQDAVTLSQLQVVNVSATAPETDPLWTGNWTNVAFTNIDETFDENLVVTKNLTVDTDTLFVNSNANNVGIGTTSPDEKLHVAGNIQLGNANQEVNIHLGDDNERVIINASRSDDTQVGKMYWDGWGNFLFDKKVGIGTSSNLQGSTASLYVNGNVGIGVVSPEARLEALASSGPQLMLTHTDNTDYANFTVDSDGNLTILSSSGNVIIQLG